MGRFIFLDLEGGLIDIFEGVLIEGPLYIVSDALLLLKGLYFDFCNIKYAGYILLNKYDLKNVVVKVVLHHFLLFLRALNSFNIFFLPKIQRQVIFRGETHAFGFQLETMINRGLICTYHGSRSCDVFILLL